MPVYNAMPYLPFAVTSILDQSFREIQLLVIDDGSNDESLNYLHTIHDSRLKVLVAKQRQGQGAARNLAIKDCDTEYLAFADADDVSLSERFTRQIEYLDLHPEVGMLGTRFAYIGTSGRPGLKPPLALSHEAIRRDLLLGRHAVANPTLMFRTSVFERTGAFRINGAGEDVDLFLRMTEHTQVANLNEILCLYRLHLNSTNAQQAQTLLRRYAHASECALLREGLQPESSFEEFCERQAKRSMWIHNLEKLHMLSGVQYRRGIVDLLDGRKIRGYTRLGCAALLSPQRLFQRLLRAARQEPKHPATAGG